jgi:2-oxoglutarate ferredoxin oxidoreductase subunit alpha
VIWPFPEYQVIEALTKTSVLFGKQRKIVLVENNADGQLGKLIRQETGINITDRILKHDGRPFFPEELVEQFIKFL